MEFTEYENRVCEIIKTIAPKYLLIEMGNQATPIWAKAMEELGIFNSVRVVESKYYNKHSCKMIECSNIGMILEDECLDEQKQVEQVMRTIGSDVTWLDFMNGRGTTSRMAYKTGCDFVCSDLNKNRLSVAIEDLQKKGAEIQFVQK